MKKVTKLKNSIGSFRSRLDHAEERISYLEQSAFEIIQTEEKRMKKSNESLWFTMKRSNIYSMGISEEK